MHMSRREFGTTVGAGLATAATATTAALAQGRISAEEARAIYARGISIDAWPVPAP